LYLDRGASAPVAILDVTNPSAPAAAGQLDLPAQEANGRLSTVVGNAALIAQSPAAVAQPLQDASRGLVYLANSDGLWVLQLEPARDIAAQKAYEDYVLYEH